MAHSPPLIAIQPQEVLCEHCGGLCTPPMRFKECGHVQCGDCIMEMQRFDPRRQIKCRECSTVVKNISLAADVKEKIASYESQFDRDNYGIVLEYFGGRSIELTLPEDRSDIVDKNELLFDIFAWEKETWDKILKQ